MEKNSLLRFLYIILIFSNQIIFAAQEKIKINKKEVVSWRPADEKESQLIRAAMTGNNKEFSVLMKRYGNKINLDRVDTDGDTALIKAIESDNYHIAIILVLKGANINQPPSLSSRGHLTPLTLAVYNTIGKKEIPEDLLTLIELLAYFGAKLDQGLINRYRKKIPARVEELLDRKAKEISATVPGFLLDIARIISEYSAE